MSFFLSYLQVLYSFWAGVYDSVLDKIFSFDRKKVVSALKVKPSDKILEVGIGTGLNLPYYPKCTVYGVDMSDAMLKKARQKSSSAKVVLKKVNAEKLDFPSNYFDKALMTFVLRVTPNPRKLLKEVSRVTKGDIVIFDQFKTSFSLLQPFMFLLGWGKQHDLNKLIKGLPLRVKSKSQFGKGTQLVILAKK